MSLKPILLAGALVLGPSVAALAQGPNTVPPPFGDLVRPSAATNASERIDPPTAAGRPGAPFVLERTVAVSEAASNADQPAPSKEVDVSALRYYAAQNDLARVAAEIRLLRARHPNWEPPADLFTEARDSVDEQPLWNLFAKHDLPGLRAAMDDLRASKPDWQPSGNLLQKVQLAEAHDSLVAASDGQRWSDVVDVAIDNKALLTCADLDTLWRTAEALVHVNDEAHAIEAYRYVLANCAKPQDRLATVQKAGAILTTPGAVDGLISLGRRGQDGRNEFESLRLDAVRRAIGEAAAGKAAVPPTAKYIATLEAAYAASKAPADAQLLGWYAYSQKDFGKAETWFRASLSVKSDAKSAEGLVLALRDQAKLGEAEDVAMQNRDLDVPNRKIFIEVSAAALLASKPTFELKPEQIDAFTRAVETDQSAEGAQALGWHFYNDKNAAQAEIWFRKSMTWKPNENAAVGLMITARQLKHDRDFADLVARYRGQFTRVAELETALRLRRGGAAVASNRAASNGKTRRGASAPGEGWDAGADAIVSTFKAGQYDQALAMLDARKGRQGEPHGLSVVRGWAQYHKGDWDSAQRTFADLQQKAPSQDSETGLRVIQQGYLPKAFR